MFVCTFVSVCVNVCACDVAYVASMCLHGVYVASMATAGDCRSLSSTRCMQE